MIKLPSEYIAESESDKTKAYHRYGDFYDVVIPSLVMMNGNAPINVLEIGTTRFGAKGSSQAFIEMPYVDQYVGIDLHDIPNHPNKFKMFVGNAYSTEMVENVKEYSPYHLMIDDGSHQPDDWNFFIEHYIKLGGVPGVLVVEDVDYPEGVTHPDIIWWKHVDSGKGGRIGLIVNYKEVAI